MITVEKYKSVYVYEIPEDIENFIFCGDIHGEFETICHKLCKQCGLENTVLMVLGDSGFGFYKYGYYTNLFQKLDHILSKCNNYILFGRGNHDSSAYFNELSPFRSERTFCIPDYSVIQGKNGTSILWVGGGVSVDRLDRIADDAKHYDKYYSQEECYRPQSYWKNELPVFSKDKLDEISECFVIDTVATHSCPSFVGLTNKDSIAHRLKKDSKLSDDLKFERSVMDRILNYLTDENSMHSLSRWFYGHFHKSIVENISNIQFNMLDINEFKELRYFNPNNTTILC